MFQYACVKALSLREGVGCSFPEKTPNLHDIFALSAKKDFKQDTEETLRLYKEPRFTYTEIPVGYRDLILEGYFQSEKYFIDCKDVIREEFTFKNPVNYEVTPGSCSIHVRRGDYLNIQKDHPLCDMEYYNKAMKLMGSDNYLVFSDDPDWCSDHFKGDQFTIVSGNTAEEDMQIMSKCDDNIIANSSFSWWAAWLNTNEQQRVVAPGKWFGDITGMETTDLYLKDWIIL